MFLHGEPGQSESGRPKGGLSFPGWATLIWQTIPQEIWTTMAAPRVKRDIGAGDRTLAAKLSVGAALGMAKAGQRMVWLAQDAFC